MSVCHSAGVHQSSVGAVPGITEEMIDALVYGFYAKVRTDPALGPIFNRVIAHDRWPAHLGKMCDFWSSVMLKTGRFNGAPMAVHIRVGGIRPTHFARWLHLFGQTARELCPPEVAAAFSARAEIIAQSLQLNIAASRGELPRAPDQPGAQGQRNGP
ncbi:MAG: group III truncated hemoglobin [Caulobacteraceae bacterium]